MNNWNEFVGENCVNLSLISVRKIKKDIEKLIGECGANGNICKICAQKLYRK